jgi:hypothetical protein
VGKVLAKKVTVCLHLHRAFAFAGTAGAHLVPGGACWRVVKIVRNARHTVRPVARSFVRHVVIHACNGVTVEARGVDLRNTRFCIYVLAVVKKPGGGVTG